MTNDNVVLNEIISACNGLSEKNTDAGMQQVLGNMKVGLLKEHFAIVYTETKPRIFSFVLKRVEHADIAEDITSETYLRTWQYLLESGQTMQSMWAFLYRVARNLVYDHYRKDTSMFVRFDDITQGRSGEVQQGAMHTKLEQRECIAKIHQAIENLNRNCRNILIWHDIENRTIEEIALLSGKLPNAVYVTLHRARRKIREYLCENPRTKRKE